MNPRSIKLLRKNDNDEKEHSVATSGCDVNAMGKSKQQVDTKKATSSHAGAVDMDREEALVRLDQMISHSATQNDPPSNEDAMSACSSSRIASSGPSPGDASPIKPEMGRLVPDTQIIDNASRNPRVNSRSAPHGRGGH